MAPEEHGAQVLRDLGSKKVTLPHQIRGALQLLFYKVFTKMHSLGSRGTLAPFMHPIPWGWGGYLVKKTKSLPTLKDHLC